MQRLQIGLLTSFYCKKSALTSLEVKLALITTKSLKIFLKVVIYICSEIDFILFAIIRKLIYVFSVGLYISN